MTGARVIFDFDEPKAIETILYLANRLSQSSKYTICKTLYSADKLCLERYGRFIFGETYVAMIHGAVPSHAYNLLKEISNNPIDGITIEGNSVIPARDANLDYLSESDIECLDQTIEASNKDFEIMVDDAHDNAWAEAWSGRDDGRGSVAMPIHSIANTLSNPKDILDYIAILGGS